MKKILSFLVPVLLISACSTPRYTYHFDHYDYNVGKKETSGSAPVAMDAEVEAEMPVFHASAEITLPEALRRTEEILPAPDVKKNHEPDEAAQLAEAREKYLAMDRSERKAFRKEVKKELKRMIRERKADAGEGVSAVNAMDNDLKLAIIFGAVGLTLSLFSGINPTFWVLGVIAIVVGVVFLIKWLVRQ